MPQAKPPRRQEQSPTHQKMRGQKNRLQMKKQGKNLQDQINEEEIGNSLKKNSE